jgi:hypothetical protein
MFARKVAKPSASPSGYIASLHSRAWLQLCKLTSLLGRERMREERERGREGKTERGSKRRGERGESGRVRKRGRESD